jgi:hypothetical protein
VCKFWSELRLALAQGCAGWWLGQGGKGDRARDCPGSEGANETQSSMTPNGKARC